MTKQHLAKLLNNGCISKNAHSTFLRAAKSFLVKVATYLQKWCPSNVKCCDFDKRQQKTFMAIEFFLCRFSHLFQNIDMDDLAEQFMAYQVLPDDALLSSVKTAMNLNAEDPLHVDALWTYLNSRREPGTHRPESDQLFKVAASVLTIPHSNASEERIFSMINKNKTSSRSSLAIEGTLLSTVTVKTHITDLLNWKPSEYLRNAKKATVEYNRQHSKN